MFVRYSCGCLGLRITVGKAPAVDYVIKACDAPGDDRSLGLWQRDQSDHTFEPLPPAEIVTLIRKMDGAMGKGHKYDAIRAMLGIV